MHGQQNVKTSNLCPFRKWLKHSEMEMAAAFTMVET